MSQKNSKLRWYARFCVYTQFARKHSISTLIFSQLFSPCIWIFFSAVLQFQLFSAHYSQLSFPIIVIAFRLLSSIIERFSDSPLGYSLCDRYPLTKKDVLSMRLYAKLIQPSEIAFPLCIALSGYLLYRSIIPVLLGTIAMWIFSCCVEEFAGLILYSFYSSHAFCVLIYIGALSLSIIPFFLKAILPASTLLSVLLVTFFAGLAFMAVSLSLVGKKTGAPHIGRNNGTMCRSLKLENSGLQSQQYMLVYKEAIFLFFDKPSLLLSPFICTILFFAISDRTSSFSFLLPAFFVADFAYSYGFNFWGVEQKGIIPVFMSPAETSRQIRAKSIMLYIVGITGIIVFVIAEAIFINAARSFLLKSMLSALVILALFSMVAPYASIRYYQPDDRISKVSIKRMLLFILLFALTSIAIGICSELQLVWWGAIIFTLLILAAALFCTLKETNIYVSRFQLKQSSMLERASIFE